MQCLQRIFIGKLNMLQTRPLLKQHMPSYSLSTRVTTKTGLHMRVFAYQATCNTGRIAPTGTHRQLIIRFCSHGVGSEVTKPILLYRGDQKRLFQFVSFFAVSQLIFWGYLTHMAFTSMKDSYMKQQIRYGPEGAPKELRKWTTWEGIKLNMSASRWRYGITVLSMATGVTILVFSFLYSRKNINALVLRQGGQHLTFKTYGIFAQGYTFTVPVRNVSCEYTRHGQRRTLPIKVKDHKMFYTLDTGDGKFYNGRLFDSLVTVKRHF